MKQVQEFLKGKKTYIVATLLTLASLTNLLAGDITFVEFVNSDKLWVLLNGLGLGTLRAAIRKVELGE